MSTDTLKNMGPNVCGNCPKLYPFIFVCFSIQLNEADASIKEPASFTLCDHFKNVRKQQKKGTKRTAASYQITVLIKRTAGLHPRKYLNRPSSGVVVD